MATTTPIPTPRPGRAPVAPEVDPPTLAFDPVFPPTAAAPEAAPVHETVPEGFTKVQYEPTPEGERTVGFESTVPDTELDLGDPLFKSHIGSPLGRASRVMVTTATGKRYCLELENSALIDMSQSADSAQTFLKAKADDEVAPAVQHGWMLPEDQPVPLPRGGVMVPRSRPQTIEDVRASNPLVRLMPKAVTQHLFNGTPDPAPATRFPNPKVGHGWELAPDTTTDPVTKLEVEYDVTKDPVDPEDYEQRGPDPFYAADGLLEVLYDFDRPEPPYASRDLPASDPIQGTLRRMHRAVNSSPVQRGRRGDPEASWQPAPSAAELASGLRVWRDFEVRAEEGAAESTSRSAVRERLAQAGEWARQCMEQAANLLKGMRETVQDYYLHPEFGRRRRAVSGIVLGALATGSVTYLELKRRDALPTRERVRQLGSRVVQRIPDMPTLETLRSRVAEVLPDKERITELQERASAALAADEEENLRGRAAAKAKPYATKARRLGKRSFAKMVDTYEKRMQSRRSSGQPPETE